MATASADANLTLKVFRGVAGLRELAPQWSALAEQLTSPALSQYPEYYQAYTAAFSPQPDECFITAFYRDESLVAVMPMRAVRRKAIVLGVWALKFPEIPMPIRDVLVLPGVSFQGILHCLTEQLETETPWHYLHLARVLETSVVPSIGSISEKTLAVRRRVGNSHALDVSASGYIQTHLNSRARNNLRRNRKKLAGLGRYEFRTADSLPALETAFESFLDAEAAGWKSVRGGKRAVKLHRNQTDFYRDLMRRSAAQGRCHIHLLLLDGRAIAADYCILTKNSCYSLKHGYDEKFSSVAPGNLLREYTINYYCARPKIRSVDLISEQPWHLTWRPVRRKVFDIKIFKPTTLGRLLYYFFKSRAGAQEQQ